LKRIGIYGGSFDPIHHAHLILAREALETLQLAEVIFVLAAQSPHKTGEEATNAAVRWEMLSSAIAGEPGFTASRLEIDRPAPSYTIETVEAFRSADPEAEFFFLLGEDNLPRLTSWHRFEKLRQLVRFIVLERSGRNAKFPYPTVRKRIDISAATIRKRIASGQSIRYLVPEAVEEIIRQKKLYQERNKSNPKS
jgi:nicotinate-nucleotide adenylyltransferase